MRQYLYQHAVVESKLIVGQAEEGAKFADYFAYLEHWKSIPSHRAVAIFRGPDEAILTLNLRLNSQVGEQKPAGTAPFNAVEMLIAGFVSIADQRRPAGKWLTNVVRSTRREKAGWEAINDFARNLKDLLLAAPAGRRDHGNRPGRSHRLQDRGGGQHR